MIIRCCGPHKDPRSSSTCDYYFMQLPDLFELVFVGVVRWLPPTVDGNAYFQCPKCQAVNKYRIVAPKNSIAPKETLV